MKKNWLQKTVARAVKEVNSWSAWKKETARIETSLDRKAALCHSTAGRGAQPKTGGGPKPQNKTRRASVKASN